MAAEPRARQGFHLSARMRLTLSYEAFLLVAGAATLAGVYLVLRYVPDYPLTAANPRSVGSVASRQEILDSLVRMSAAIMAVLGVVGLAGGWFLAGWILRPLRHINEAARIAATGRLDHRIRLSGRTDEFRQLADSFDHMLDRLHDAFETQERFTANASHELRTPLTVTATLLEVARADTGTPDFATLLERLQLTNDRAIGLTESLLRLADANAITAASRPVDLATIVQSTLDERLAEADRRQVRLELLLDEAPTLGEETLLRQMAANLIGNALDHNVESGSAQVSTRHDVRASAVVLRVENTGRQYTDEGAARLAEPFLRGAGRTTRDGEHRGHGLGLALVARIAAVHDGTLTIAPRAGGGLVVTVTLPDHPR